MPHALNGCRLKLARAREHLEALRVASDAFWKLNPYAIVGEFDAQAGEYVFKVRVYEEPPPYLGVIVGDVVHNLRSALDYLAWELVKLAPATPREGVTGFPIFESEDEFLGKGGGRGAGPMLRGMRDEHQEFIQGLQPYHGGDEAPAHFLAHLRRLSNTDKHRTLHLALAIIEEDGIVLSELVPVRDVEPPDRSLVRGRAGPLEDGAEFMRVPVTPTGPHPKVHVQGGLHLQIALRDGEPTNRVPVAPLLDDVLEWVQRDVYNPLALDFT